MAPPHKTITSSQHAAAEGYRPIASLAGFLEAKGQAHLLAETASGLGVDCQTAPPGTKCFDRVYPDGSHVVGFCDGNGNCRLQAG